jgi:hypothetical protein
MRPVSGAAIYRPDIGVQVLEFAEGPAVAFIGLQVMPIYPVDEQAASYLVIPKEALLKIPKTKRGSRAKYNRNDWNYENGIYSTSEQGTEEPVDDGERSKLDRRAPGLADRVATRRAWNIIMRGQEQRIASMVFSAVNFSAHAVTHEWDDSTNAVPINDVDTGKNSIRLACGMVPDTLIISYSTFLNLRNCEQIVGRLKYTFPGMEIGQMGSRELAQIFDLAKVLVGGAVYDSAGAGLDASIADLWSNEYAMLTITAPTMASDELASLDILTPCIGRTFLWTEDSPQNPIVEVYREEAIRSDVYRVRHHVSESLIQSKDTSGTVVSDISAACSYLFSNITT